ncbi:MAG: hypothetical protein AAFX09_08250 [Pseudomonadota bacterium]
MTDGPYRTLPLKKPWRDSAEALTLNAFSSSEAQDRIEHAVVRTFRDDGCPGLVEDLKRAFLGDERGPLLIQETPEQLIARLSSTHPFSDLNSRLIRNAAAALERGESGLPALRGVVESSARETAESAYADMADHYQTHATSGERSRLASGIEQARNELGYQAVTDRILDRGASPVATPPKREGLDDGVALR